MSFVKRYKETMAKVLSKADDKDYNYTEAYKKRLIDFRKYPNTVTKTEKPINLVRARELGYKAKKGVLTVVVRVPRGGGSFTAPNRARRPKRMGFKKLTRNINSQRIAELRASSRYINCEVINSYYIGEDGKHKYYEVILAAKNQKEVLKDKNLSKMVKQTGRTERGLTKAGKKTRGLLKKKQ